MPRAHRLRVEGGVFHLTHRCNRRKGRLDAVWGDNFHATLVDSGRYLWRCLSYIELNMVRCGAVRHPSQWEWVGYHEMMGRRQRYRLVDLERLCWRLGTTNLEEVRRNLEAMLRERIEQDELKREPCWTESLAVGSPEFVKRIQPLILSRRETEIVEEQAGLWVLKEEETPYSSDLGSKIGSKPRNRPAI